MFVDHTVRLQYTTPRNGNIYSTFLFRSDTEENVGNRFKDAYDDEILHI